MLFSTMLLRAVPDNPETGFPSRRRVRALRRRLAGWLQPEDFELTGSGTVDVWRPAVGYRPSVLVAGADEAQVLLLRRTLEIDGCDVLSCPSGTEAVRLLLTGTPDLILVNAPLSDSSASALLRWVRARPQTSDVSCMAIVGSAEPHVAASLYDAGADFVITRPTELDLLSRRVTAALSRRPLELAS